MSRTRIVPQGESSLTPQQRMAIPRQEMPEQPSSQRIHNFQEVALGWSEPTARIEARRCLQCKKPACVKGCPVGIDIPGFIQKIAEGEFAGGMEILRRDNVLPAVCGRVCPQEEQCEKNCVLGKTGDPVAIGRLERFLADWERNQPNRQLLMVGKDSGKRVAIVGSGPAGLTAAGDLRRLGHVVDVYEALHRLGGVLVYGIPEFRLPKIIVKQEVEKLEAAGVRFFTSIMIGQTISLEELQEEYDAIFIGSGAGLPNFMNIPGENLCGVYSANEYLTRVNLMRAYEFPVSDTPIVRGSQVAVVGGGNVAMDSARTAKRLGAEKVILIYRRTRAEMPARLEEIKHAEEEGIEFFFLHNPLHYLGDAQGKVCEVICQKMALGPPDASGRPRPVPTAEKVNFAIDVAVVAIGNGPNPLLPRSSAGLETDSRGRIRAEKDTGKTSIKGLFAGGDIVLGAATVIRAMGAGRLAARAIHEYLETGT